MFIQVSKAILRREKKKKKTGKGQKKPEMPSGHEMNMGMSSGGFGNVRLSVAKPNKGGKKKKDGCCKSS